MHSEEQRTVFPSSQDLRDTVTNAPKTRERQNATHGGKTLPLDTVSFPEPKQHKTKNAGGQLCASVLPFCSPRWTRLSEASWASGQGVGRRNPSVIRANGSLFRAPASTKHRCDVGGRRRLLGGAESDKHPSFAGSRAFELVSCPSLFFQ